jgi:hypothetical protein
LQPPQFNPGASGEVAFTVLHTNGCSTSHTNLCYGNITDKVALLL